MSAPSRSSRTENRRTTRDTNTKKGYDLINRRRKQWANEEEVRHTWMKELEEALQIDLDAERAKRDSSYNNVVI